MYVTWKEWRQLKKEINQIVANRLPNWKERPITAMDARGIRQDVEFLFDDLESQIPEWKTEFGFPPRAVEFWEKRQQRSEGIGYFPVFRKSMPTLMQLSGNEIKVLLVYANHAWVNEKANRRTGMQPGETYVGNATVSRESGVGEGHLYEYIKTLREIGFLVNMRKHPRTGTWIRRVVMNPSEWPSSQVNEVPVVEPVEPRSKKNEHSEENQAETYDNEEWTNYESSPSQTQAEPIRRACK